MALHQCRAHWRSVSRSSAKAMEIRGWRWTHFCESTLRICGSSSPGEGQAMNQTTNKWQFLNLFAFTQEVKQQHLRLGCHRPKGGSKIPLHTPLMYMSHVGVSRATAGSCLSINPPPTSCFFHRQPPRPTTIYTTICTTTRLDDKRNIILIDVR